MTNLEKILSDRDKKKFIVDRYKTPYESNFIKSSIKEKFKIDLSEEDFDFLMYSMCLGKYEIFSKLEDYYDKFNIEYKINNNKIINIKIKHVYERILISEYLERFRNNYFSNDLIREYAIERVFCINNLYLSDSWKPNIERGFEFDEFISVEMKNYYRILSSLSFIVHAKDDNQIIEYILSEENNYLPIEAQYKNWEIDIINKKNITTNRKIMSQKIKSFELDSYIPLGIYLKDDDKYELLDGHERFANAPDEFFAIIGSDF